MPSILPFYQIVFSKDETRLALEVLHSACGELDEGDHPDVVFEIVARHIIEDMKKGERDPVHLRDNAIAKIPQRKLGTVP